MPSHTLLKAQFRVLMCENENDSLFHPTILGMEANTGESIDVGLTRKTIQYYGIILNCCHDVLCYMYPEIPSLLGKFQSSVIP